VETECRLEFPQSWEKEGLLEHDELDVVWDGKDGELKHLERVFGNAYVFDQDDRLDSKELNSIMSPQQANGH
jgi:hypothetical protein